MFTVDNSRRYFVASFEDGKEVYGNVYDTREEAQAWCDAVPFHCYVVYRRPL